MKNDNSILQHFREASSPVLKRGLKPGTVFFATPTLKGGVIKKLLLLLKNILLKEIITAHNCS